MNELLIGVLEVVGIIVLFLGVVYLIQRSHKSRENTEPAQFSLIPKLKGNYLLAFRLSIALMVLSMLGFAITRWLLLVWIALACLVMYGVLTWIGRVAPK